MHLDSNCKLYSKSNSHSICIHNPIYLSQLSITQLTITQHATPFTHSSDTPHNPQHPHSHKHTHTRSDRDDDRCDYASASSLTLRHRQRNTTHDISFLTNKSRHFRRVHFNIKNQTRFSFLNFKKEWEQSLLNWWPRVCARKRKVKRNQVFVNLFARRVIFVSFRRAVAERLLLGNQCRSSFCFSTQFSLVFLRIVVSIFTQFVVSFYELWCQFSHNSLFLLRIVVSTLTQFVFYFTNCGAIFRDSLSLLQIVVHPHYFFELETKRCSRSRQAKPVYCSNNWTNGALDLNWCSSQTMCTTLSSSWPVVFRFDSERERRPPCTSHRLCHSWTLLIINTKATGTTPGSTGRAHRNPSSDPVPTQCQQDQQQQPQSQQHPPFSGSFQLQSNPSSVDVLHSGFGDFQFSLRTIWPSTTNPWQNELETSIPSKTHKLRGLVRQLYDCPFAATFGSTQHQKSLSIHHIRFTTFESFGSIFLDNVQLAISRNISAFIPSQVGTRSYAWKCTRNITSSTLSNCLTGAAVPYDPRHRGPITRHV